MGNFKKSAAANDAHEPAPLPAPASGGNGTIGRQRAAVFVMGPLREIARLTAEDEGVEPDAKRARKQKARCLRAAHDELRVRVGYHMGSAQRWELVTEATLAAPPIV